MPGRRRGRPWRHRGLRPCLRPPPHARAPCSSASPVRPAAALKSSNARHERSHGILEIRTDSNCCSTAQRFNARQVVRRIKNGSVKPRFPNVHEHIVIDCDRAHDDKGSNAVPEVPLHAFRISLSDKTWTTSHSRRRRRGGRKSLPPFRMLNFPPIKRGR
jgi:hypothetical protein